MKALFKGALGTALLLMAGCDNSNNYNNHPGGPGAPRTSEAPRVLGQNENSISLSVPSLSTKIKQGETKTISIAIKRGKNFDQDVKLGFSGAPKGLTVEPSAHSIRSADNEVNVTMRAADDAPLGDFTIKVTGTPAQGPAAEADLKVTIAKK
jgi:uncharacterized membrane protein